MHKRTWNLQESVTPVKKSQDDFEVCIKGRKNQTVEPLIMTMMMIMIIIIVKYAAY